MAVAMPRSLTPLLLVLALSTTTVPAALTICPAGGEAIAKACDGTTTLKKCVGVLIVNPYGKAPHRLVELAYTYLVKDGEALYKETQAAIVTAATMPEAAQNCAKTLNTSMKFYYDSVIRFVPKKCKKRFDEAKSNLDKLLSYTSSIDAMDCPELPIKEKVSYYKDLQKVTQDLMSSANTLPKDPKKKEETAKSVKAPAT